jgi:hypothetical protein
MGSVSAEEINLLTDPCGLQKAATRAFRSVNDAHQYQPANPPAGQLFIRSCNRSS